MVHAQLVMSGGASGACWALATREEAWCKAAGVAHANVKRLQRYPTMTITMLETPVIEGATMSYQMDQAGSPETCMRCSLCCPTFTLLRRARVV